jgi:hypothetical protein
MDVKYGFFHTKGRTQIESVWEQGAEENVCTYEGGKWREVEENFIMTTGDLRFLGGCNAGG